jgi:hypothetical protein
LRVVAVAEVLEEVVEVVIELAVHFQFVVQQHIQLQ